jgi:hypothetical protein
VRPSILAFFSRTMVTDDLIRVAGIRTGWVRPRARNPRCLRAETRQRPVPTTGVIGVTTAVFLRHGPSSWKTHGSG